MNSGIILMSGYESPILILDDDEIRLERFTRIINEISPRSPVRCWRDANKMMGEAAAYLSGARLISLDHDLYPVGQAGGDPGDGLMVAKFLASRPPQCPVIVHSSNGDRATMMIGELEFAGWNVRRVAPLGSDWVENYWAAVVRSLLAAPPEHSHTR